MHAERERPGLADRRRLERATSAERLSVNRNSARVGAHRTCASVLLTTVAVLFWLQAGSGPVAAGDASWTGSSGTPTNYDNSANWNPSGPPGNNAIFGASSYYGTTAAPIVTTGNVSINTWNFSTAPQTYFLTLGPGVAEFLTVSPAGAGIIGSNANITNNAFLEIGSFSTTVGLGGATYSNNDAIYIIGGTAGTANITNNAASGLTYANETYLAVSFTPVPVIVFQGDNTTASAGSATITNHGEVDFDFNSTAATATINNYNTLYFYGSSTAANATITTENGGRTYFLYLPNYPSGDIPSGGSARMIVHAGGVLDISAMSDGSACCTTAPYGNPVTFTTGSIEGAGNIYLGANTLAVGNLNTNSEFSGVIHDGPSPYLSSDFGIVVSGGVGSLTKIGTGTLILSGNNTYTGLTTIAAGTLQLGNPATNGGTTGSVAGNILDDAALVFARSNTYTYAGQISGSGTVAQNGTGTLVLSDTNTYTGATSVNLGTLEVDGSIAHSTSVTVNNGGTLSGIGVVDPNTTTIMSGGTLAPGNAAHPTGTLTITGNLAFQPGAIYGVQLTPTNASSVVVNGAAALNGAVQANFASGSYVSKTYTILTATGGVTGTFSGISNVNLPSGASDSLSYGSDDAYLNVTAGFANYTGLNTNQQNVATALTNYFNTTGGIAARIFGVSPAGLSQLDGEAATGPERSAFQLTNEFLNLMLDPFVNGRGYGPGAGGQPGGGGAIGFAADEQAGLPSDVALAYASIFGKAPPKNFDQRWSACGAAYGGSSNTNGDPTVGSHDITTGTYGFAAGMDYHASPSTVLGFAMAGAGTNWGLSSGLGGGYSDALQIGTYGISWFGPAYLAGALSFSNHWFATNRSSLGDQLTADFVGQSYGARFEGGYRFIPSLPSAAGGGGLGWGLGVTPYAALQVQDFQTPSYSESDVTGGGFGLSYNAMNATDVRTELGARFDDPTLLYGRPLILFGRLAWAHDFVSNPALSAAFESLAGSTFTVNGAPIPRNSALTTVGAQYFLASNWSVIGKFDGEFAAGSQTYGGSGTLRYTW